jgi:nucleoside recognition membrane protein YjiH
MTFFVFSVITAAMATIAALVALHAPIFSWLGYPFIGLFPGFMDQYMPAVAASHIDSKITSFILAGVSVCQFIYLSEVGVIILRSSLPLLVLDFVAVFMLRTIIVLPILVHGAHLVAG